MTAPTGPQLAERTKAALSARGLSVPIHWSQFFPSGNPGLQQFSRALPAGSHDVPEPTMGSDLLFQRSLSCRHLTRVQESISRIFADFIDQICMAISTAWCAWELAAKMTGVLYTAGMASGGTMLGPPWTPTIVSLGPPFIWTPMIAAALDAVWLQFQSSLTLTGAPLFIGNTMIPIPPGGDAQPGLPPPTGMLPMSVAFPTQFPLTPSMISGMLQHDGAFAADLFAALAEAFVGAFDAWRQSLVICSSSFLLTCINPSPVPIPRLVGTVPITTAPLFIGPPQQSMPAVLHAGVPKTPPQS